jgi:hypothetical protein
MQYGKDDCVSLLLSYGASLEKGNADDAVSKNPDILFQSPFPLAYCRSPVTVLNTLYKPLSEGTLQSKMSEIMSKYINNIVIVEEARAFIKNIKKFSIKNLISLSI